MLGVQVNIGRLEDNTMAIADSEISGHHVSMRWDAASRAWQVIDLGSLNGTMLNDRIISTSNHKLGRALRLSSDDILQLGSRTKLKVTCMPHEMSQVGLPLPPFWLAMPDSFSVAAVQFLSSKWLVVTAGKDCIPHRPS